MLFVIWITIKIELLLLLRHHAPQKILIRNIMSTTLQVISKFQQLPVSLHPNLDNFQNLLVSSLSKDSLLSKKFMKIQSVAFM